MAAPAAIARRRAISFWRTRTRPPAADAAKKGRRAASIALGPEAVTSQRFDAIFMGLYQDIDVAI
jgi:hypothetical protein